MKLYQHTEKNRLQKFILHKVQRISNYFLKQEFSFFNSFTATLATLLLKSVLKISILFRSLAVTPGTLISAAQLGSYQTFLPNQSNLELQETLNHVAKYAEYLKCGMIMKVRAVGRLLGIAEPQSSFRQGEDAGSCRLTQMQHLPVLLCGQPQLPLPIN